MLSAQYVDFDGDGYADHVVGPDGVPYPFNPFTGEMGSADGSSLGATPTGAFSTGVGLSSSGGGSYGRSPAPPLPPPQRAASPPAPAASPQMPAGAEGMLPSVPQMQAPPPVSPAGAPAGQYRAPAHTIYPRSSPAERTYHERAGTLSSGGSYPGMPGTNGTAFGSGTNSNPRYQALYGKGQAMAGKLRGMASDMESNLRYGGGGSGGSYGGSTSSSYSGSSYGYPEPPKPKMRGLAKGMDPQQAEAVQYRPTLLLPQLAKGIPADSEWYDTLEELPASSLALLGSAHRKSTPRNAISMMINGTGDAYQDAMRGTLPSFGQMANAFTTASRKSALGQLMRPPPPERTITGYGKDGKPNWSREEPDYYTSPLLTAADTASGLIDAIGQASAMDDRSIDAMNEYGSYLIDKFGGNALRSKPSKMPMINRAIGRRLF